MPVFPGLHEARWEKDDLSTANPPLLSFSVSGVLEVWSIVCIHLSLEVSHLFMRSRNPQNFCRNPEVAPFWQIPFVFSHFLSPRSILILIFTSTNVLSHRLVSNKILYNSVHTCYKPRPSYYSNVIVPTYFRYYEAVIFTDFLFLHHIFTHYNNSILQNSEIFLFIIWLFQDAVLCGNDGRVIMKGVCVPEQVTHGLI